MARDAFLHIKVVDETGKERVPGANDKVLVDGTALTYDATNGFVHAIKGKSDLSVLVIYKGFATLQQSFEAEAQVETPSLKQFWGGSDDDPDKSGAKRPGYLLECMSLNATGGGSGDKKSPRVFALSVKLFPTREYVAVVGADYWEGPDEEHAAGHHASLDFDRGAVTFADHLFFSDTLNRGSPMTVIDCQRGRGDIWMRIANTKRPWRRQSSIDSSFLKKPAPKWATDKAFVAWLEKIVDGTENALDYLGATDVYAYLNGVGANRPGTVADFSIFSHSWQGGPILYNTVSQTERARQPARDPQDLDMRASQDFNSTNKGSWSDMPKAFASDANSHVWGCFATTLFLHMVQHVLSGSKSNFKETADTTSGPLKLDLTKADVLTRIKDAIANSYMKKLAQFTGVPAFGGPPGFGADLTEYNAITTIPSRLRSRIGPRKQGFVPRTWQPKSKFRKIYETKDLGENTFDIFGYLKHGN